MWIMCDELKRNGSGYYDPTAYEALKNVRKEELKMGFKRGEIYECEIANGTDMKYALVVSCDARQNDRYLSIVMLNTEPYGRNPVEIKVLDMCYADCDRVSFAEQRRLGNFVRMASEKEMQEIDARLAEAIGLGGIDHQESASRMAQVDEYRMRIEGLERELDNKKTEISDLTGKLKEANGLNVILNQDAVRDLIKAETERDLYKELYKQLFEKMIVEKMIG